MQPKFRKRGVKLLGLSSNAVDSRRAGWSQDINEISGCDLTFPLIGDKERKIAYAYDMIDDVDTTNIDTRGMPLTIRS
jgi:alkyl hydroperoxide reductase subunit AhpC